MEHEGDYILYNTPMLSPREWFLNWMYFGRPDHTAVDPDCAHGDPAN